jgi:hypothetical protein
VKFLSPFAPAVCSYENKWSAVINPQGCHTGSFLRTLKDFFQFDTVLSCCMDSSNRQASAWSQTPKTKSNLCTKFSTTGLF